MIITLLQIRVQSIAMSVSVFVCLSVHFCVLKHPNFIKSYVRYLWQWLDPPLTLCTLGFVDDVVPLHS